MKGPVIDEVGNRYGRLVVIEHVGSTKKGCATWKCQCDCGNEAVVQGALMRAGLTRSCGCLQRESRFMTRTHGHKTGGKVSKEYIAWFGMISRCKNTNGIGYKNYGGRGIRVCEEWALSFTAFLNYVGYAPSRAHSIDRWPNNDGNYEPGNVRWATRSEQARNRRPPKNGPQGEAHGRSKLTNGKVLEIRRRVAAGAARRVLAAKFGVDEETIGNIVRRETWRHI